VPSTPDSRTVRHNSNEIKISGISRLFSRSRFINRLLSRFCKIDRGEGGYTMRRAFAASPTTGTAAAHQSLPFAEGRQIRTLAMICRRWLADSLTCSLLLLLTACAPPRGSHIVVGAKNFTEQVVLGELLAQEIEAVYAQEGHPEQKVDRRFYLAGSYICQQALTSRRIDAYVEYTGTALTAILKQPLPTQHDPEQVLETVRALYASRYHVRVAQPLGFDDTFAMVVRGDDAQRLHLHTISDIAKLADSTSQGRNAWRLGVGYEFESRPDGLPGLSAAYNLHFSALRTMDLGLLYRALANHQVDIVAGNSTDGAIRALRFTVLADDRLLPALRRRPAGPRRLHRAASRNRDCNRTPRRQSHRRRDAGDE